MSGTLSAVVSSREALCNIPKTTQTESVSVLTGEHNLQVTSSKNGGEISTFRCATITAGNINIVNPRSPKWREDVTAFRRVSLFSDSDSD